MEDHSNATPAWPGTGREHASGKRRQTCRWSTCLLVMALGIMGLAMVGITSTHVSNKQEELTRQEKHKKTRDATCTSPECMRYSARLLLNMNLSAGPCQDFQSFSCGGYRSFTYLGPTRQALEALGGTQGASVYSTTPQINSRSSLNDMTLELRDVMHQAFFYDNQPGEITASQAWRTAPGKFYKGCLAAHEKEITTVQKKIFQKQLIVALEDIIPDARSSRLFEWLQGIAPLDKGIVTSKTLSIELIKLGHFVDVMFKPSENSGIAPIFIVIKPQLVETQEQLESLLKWSIENLGMKSDSYEFINLANSAWSVANCELDEQDWRTEEKKVYTNQELVRRGLPMEDIYQLCCNGANYTHTETLALSPCLPKSENSLLGQQGLILTTLMLRVRNLLPHIVSELPGNVQQYSALSLTHRPQDGACSKNTDKCLAAQRHILPFLSTRRYLDFVEMPENLQESLHTLFKHVKNGMEKKLQEEKNIKGNLKKQILSVLSSTKFAAGFPKWIKNDSIITQMYSKILSTPLTGDYIKDIFKTLKVTQSLRMISWFSDLHSGTFCFNNPLSEKLKNINSLTNSLVYNNAFPLRLAYHPLSVNAYYSSELSSVVLPLGFLRPPVLDRGLPACVLYGAAGSVLGHELSKILVHKNVSVTPREQVALADKWGVKAAFKAFEDEGIKLETEEHKSTKYLLHSFTHLDSEKMFFVSWAQLLCSKEPPSSDLRKEDSNRYPSLSERLQALVSESAEFRDTFHCKKKLPSSFTGKPKSEEVKKDEKKDDDDETIYISGSKETHTDNLCNQCCIIRK